MFEFWRQIFGFWCQIMSFEGTKGGGGGPGDLRGVLGGGGGKKVGLTPCFFAEKQDSSTGNLAEVRDDVSFLS